MNFNDFDSKEEMYEIHEEQLSGIYRWLEPLQRLTKERIKMRKMRMMFLALVALLLFQMPVSARTNSGKCIYTYCNNSCFRNSVYCRNHDFTYQYSHTKCYQSGCTRYTDTGCGSYCSTHYNQKFGKSTFSRKKNYSTSKKIDSYDEGWEALADDEDVDYKRYYSDPEYAMGVDDAADEYDLDW